MDASGMFTVGESEPLVVKQTSAFDRDAFDVNFSLMRDGSQVLTSTKKMKVKGGGGEQEAEGRGIANRGLRNLFINVTVGTPVEQACSAESCVGS
jgi:hypothetical protein